MSDWTYFSRECKQTSVNMEMAANVIARFSKLMSFWGDILLNRTPRKLSQEAVLYCTVDSGSVVGLLDKYVRNRQCLFCGI